jgi:hypothetical protein
MRRGSPALRLVRMQPPRNAFRGKPATRAQRAHRQVAWAVYISEGFAQNMRVAEMLNASEMSSEARHLLRLAIRQTEGVIAALRLHL